LQAEPNNVLEALDVADVLLTFLAPKADRTPLENQAATRLLDIIVDRDMQ